MEINMEQYGYKRIKTIGKGAFGRAVLCEARDGRKCVAKEINLSTLSRQERDSCVNEIKVLRKLNHPNIVKYVDHFSTSNVLFIVMEYADSGDMGALIKRYQQRGGGMPEEHAMHYFVQICLALKHVHEQNILHRDIKAQNIFLSRNRRMVKLGDFGISTVLRNSVALAKTQCGTPFYFSPELCKGRMYNSKSDVWSLGCLLYEMCTGYPPFGGNNMRGLMQAICNAQFRPLPNSFSSEMQSLVAALLQREPERRPSLQQLLNTNFVQAKIQHICTTYRPRPNPSDRTQKQPDQRRPNNNNNAPPPPAGGPAGGRGVEPAFRPTPGIVPPPARGGAPADNRAAPAARGAGPAPAAAPAPACGPHRDARRPPTGAAPQGQWAPGMVPPPANVNNNDANRVQRVKREAERVERVERTDRADRKERDLGIACEPLPPTKEQREQREARDQRDRREQRDARPVPRMDPPHVYAEREREREKERAERAERVEREKERAERKERERREREREREQKEPREESDRYARPTADARQEQRDRERKAEPRPERVRPTGGYRNDAPADAAPAQRREQKEVPKEKDARPKREERERGEQPRPREHRRPENNGAAPPASVPVSRPERAPTSEKPATAAPPVMECNGSQCVLPPRRPANAGAPAPQAAPEKKERGRSGEVGTDDRRDRPHSAPAADRNQMQRNRRRPISAESRQERSSAPHNDAAAEAELRARAVKEAQEERDQYAQMVNHLCEVLSTAGDDRQA